MPKSKEQRLKERPFIKGEKCPNCGQIFINPSYSEIECSRIGLPSEEKDVYDYTPHLEMIKCIQYLRLENEANIEKIKLLEKSVEKLEIECSTK